MLKQQLEKSDRSKRRRRKREKKTEERTKCNKTVGKKKTHTHMGAIV